MAGYIILVTVFIIAYVIIIEIFTVLFRLTGLTEEKARFQVISLLTSTGFTTSESELIAMSLIRRKLARVTIIFGYAFTVVIVSLIVNIFLELNRAQLNQMISVAIVFIVIGFFAILMVRFPSMKTNFDRMIEALGHRIMFGRETNSFVLIDAYGDKVMASISLTYIDKMFENVCLKDTNLKNGFDIQILVIKRHGALVEPITGETILQKDDIIVAFGNEHNMRRLFAGKTET